MEEGWHQQADVFQQDIWIGIYLVCTTAIQEYMLCIFLKSHTLYSMINNQRIIEWLRLEGTLKVIWFQPLCHGQGHILLRAHPAGPARTKEQNTMMWIVCFLYMPKILKSELFLIVQLNCIWIDWFAQLAFWDVLIWSIHLSYQS